MRRRVAGARVARLATVRADGRPDLVPCAFAVVHHALSGDTAYSAVDHKPKTTTELGRLRNLEAHPDATLLVDHYDDDWETLWWVRLRGRGRVLRDGPERERGLDALAAKYAPYAERRPDGAMIALDIDDWRGWSARG